MRCIHVIGMHCFLTIRKYTFPCFNNNPKERTKRGNYKLYVALPNKTGEDGNGRIRGPLHEIHRVLKVEDSVNVDRGVVRHSHGVGHPGEAHLTRAVEDETRVESMCQVIADFVVQERGDDHCVEGPFLDLGITNNLL